MSAQADVRAWARAEDIPVPVRGPIRFALVEAFNEAHPESPCEIPEHVLTDKRCSSCGHVKSPEAFGRRHAGRLLRSSCRPCEQAATREYNRLNPEGVRRRNRKGGLRRHSGITVEQYDAAEVAQGGICAICGRPPRGGRTAASRLHADHDHASGTFRGLLCGPCNTGLGMFGDNPERLAGAIAYLAAS